MRDELGMDGKDGMAPRTQPETQPDTGPEEMRPVGACELWGWTGPWLTGGALAAAFVLALVAASHAADELSAGCAWAAGLAALLLLIRLEQRSLEGRDGDLLKALRIETRDTLMVELAVMAALGIAGTQVAARGETAFAHVFGLALFWSCAALAFLAVKSYFDARDRRRSG